MKASSFSFPLAFALTTGATAHRDRPHIALRDFVPPSLLRGGPDFLNAALFSSETGDLSNNRAGRNHFYQDTHTQL
jgi:hypothetical protein